MRTGIRWAAVCILCCLVLGALLTSAQDATPTVDPTLAVTTTDIVATLDETTTTTPEATVDLTTTPEATVDMTTTAATTEATVAGGATAAPAAETATATTTTSTNTMTLLNDGNCDADLILNLYVAERYFGFGQVRDMMMSSSTDSSTMVDLDTIDKGQFQPLFDNLETMPSTGMTMTDEQMSSMSSMMMMSETDMMTQMATMMPAGMDMSNMTLLNAGSMPGEADECASLRGELNRFYTILAFHDLMAASDMDTTTTTNSNTSTSTENMNFGVTLSGSNEVPGPGDADGTGTAAVTVDTANGQVCYSFSVQNLALPAAAAHIHRGAAGESGSVVVPFDMAPDANGASASCVKVEAGLLSEIAQNPAGFYVNVHTSEFPDGAIRGQLSG